MKKSLYILVAAAVSMVTACDYGDINVSPNSPSEAFSSYMFTDACTYVPYFVLGSTTNGYDPWMQEWPGYISESKNNQYGPLATTSQYQSTNVLYIRALSNLDQIIKLNQDPDTKDTPAVVQFGSNANQIAASMTLSAFYYMSITDIIGPIVLSEAFQGETEDNWKPKYDVQESVYEQLENSLVSAYSMFDASEALSSADVLYGGDISKWKKLNASIRMMMAIKMSDVDPTTGKARFAKAYADGGMKDVADGLNYTYDDLTWNRLYYWVSPDYSGAGFTQVPNAMIVDTLKAYKDPRTFKYFDLEGYRGTRDPEKFPRGEYSSYYGIPFGLKDNNEVAKWVPYTCCIPSAMYGMTATVPVIPAARVLLIEAEAAQRGWITASAKDLYEAGIKASFEQWGAEGADDYVASAGVAYGSAPEGELYQIAIQRWIASYLSHGGEAWADWRRLDIPFMPVGPGAIDSGNTHYPYRLGYYSDYDVAYNYDNYLEALKDLSGGEDNVSNRVWWDTKDNRTGVLTDAQCTPPTL